jgi:hypothetical protein
MASFGKIKQELSDFIAEANTDVVILGAKNKDMLDTVKHNVERTWEIKSEIKQANRSIKQINKLMGGK